MNRASGGVALPDGVTLAVQPIPPGASRPRQRAAGRTAVLRAARAAPGAYGHDAAGAPTLSGPELRVSLSYGTSAAVAAVTDRRIQGLGVDVEDRPLPADAHRLVLSDAERGDWDGDLALLRWIRTVKEAGFKAFPDRRRCHGGIYWRVGVRRLEDRWSVHVGEERADVWGVWGDTAALALAVRSQSRIVAPLPVDCPCIDQRAGLRNDVSNQISQV